MKIAVLGLWHLGSVTAACCAEHFSVTGLDPDDVLIAGLKEGRAPIMEPGLDALLQEGIRQGRLGFTTDERQACQDADILWICDDTPVDADDVADTEYVLTRVRRAAQHLPSGAVLIVSSQMPVGTCGKLQEEFPELHVVCCPENLRLGKALEVFRSPERIVLGVRDADTKARLEPIFSKWSQNLLWMSPESAEMTKHGINTFLAMSVTFMNELAKLCEKTGANAREVEQGLKSESRIGPRAFLRAGGAFAGGTLARDVVALTRIAAEKSEPLRLIPCIKESNDQHKLWALQRLKEELGDLKGRPVAIVGLTYKPGTDTLRRSLAVELCHALLNEGVDVRAYDPAIRSQPSEIGNAVWHAIMADAVAGADAVVVCTGWPEIREADWGMLLGKMRRPFILDADGFISSPPTGARYLSVGRPAWSPSVH